MISELGQASALLLPWVPLSPQKVKLGLFGPFTGVCLVFKRQSPSFSPRPAERSTGVSSLALCPASPKPLLTRSHAHPPCCASLIPCSCLRGPICLYWPHADNRPAGRGKRQVRAGGFP